MLQFCMNNRLLLLSLVTVLGCDNGDSNKRNLSSSDVDLVPSVVEVVAVNDGADGERLRFKIDAVYRKQRLLSQPPWHEPHGDSTFFEAHTEDGARFGLGWSAKPNDGPFSDAIFAVKNADSGARLVAGFARVFGIEEPAGRPRQPLRIRPTSLLVHESEGQRVAGKLVLERRGVGGHVLVNFDLEKLLGYFTGVEEHLKDDLLAFMAREFRDGPALPRTPENDARISLVGPKFDDWRTVAPPGAFFERFEGHGTRLVYEIEEGAFSRLVSVSLDNLNDRVELARVEHSIDRFTCKVGFDDPCLVEQGVHRARNITSSDDPARFFLVSRTKKRAFQVEGPWGLQGEMLSAPLSSDDSIIAVGSYLPTKDGQSIYRALHFVPQDPNAGVRPVTFTAGEEESLDVEGWVGKGRDLRAIVIRGWRNGWSRNTKPTWMLVDPRTGEHTDLPSCPESVPDPTLSPDKRHRVSCDGKGKILITEVATSRTRSFLVTPEEQRALHQGCATWASSRYLDLETERPGFIDIETLKLSFPFEDEEELGPEYDETFTWAVQYTSSGLEVGRVVVR